MSDHNDKILAAAVAVSRKHGFRNLTLARIAEKLGWTKAHAQYRGVRVRELAKEMERRGLREGKPEATTGPLWAARTKDRQLEVAYRIASRDGFMRMTRDAVAEACGCSQGSVTGMWGGMRALREAVATKARREHNEKLTAQAAAFGL